MHKKVENKCRKYTVFIVQNVEDFIYTIQTINLQYIILYLYILNIYTAIGILLL